MKKYSRMISAMLSLAMAVSLLPAVAVGALADELDLHTDESVYLVSGDTVPEEEQAELQGEVRDDTAGKYIDMMIGSGVIGNGGPKSEPTDMMQNFPKGVAGFVTKFEGRAWKDNKATNIWRLENADSLVTFQLKTSMNDTLKALSMSETAEYRVHGSLDGHRKYLSNKVCYSYERPHIRVYEDGKNVFHESTKTEKKQRVSYDTGWQSFHDINVLKIKLSQDVTDGLNNVPDQNSPVEVYLELRDKGKPSLTGFTTGTNGVKSGKQLLINLGSLQEGTVLNDPDVRYNEKNTPDYKQDYVDVTFSFSKPVIASITVDSGSNPTVAAKKTALNNAIAENDTAQANVTDCISKIDAANEKLEWLTKAKDDITKLVPLLTTVNEYLPDQEQVEEEDKLTYASEWKKLSLSKPNDLSDDPTDDELKQYEEALADYQDKLYKKTVANSITSDQWNQLVGLKALIPAYLGQNPSDVYNSTIYNAFNGAELQEDEAASAAVTRVIGETFTTPISNVNAQLLQLSTQKTNLESILQTKEEAVTAAQTAYSDAVQYAEEQALRSANMSDGLKAVASHTLFNNSLGTGYVGQGDKRGLEIYQARFVSGYRITDKYAYANSIATKAGQTPGVIGKPFTSLFFRYSAQRGDYTGNNPIRDGGGIESGNSYGVSLIKKIDNAGFHDVAGNPLEVNFQTDYGKNIFDKNESSGYDVIVDAEPPTYTRVGNGIEPDILTQVVLNKNDTVDFIVTFSEGVKAVSGMEIGKTYLLFNNGARAYYSRKYGNDKNWVFSYTVKGSENETDVALWKVIALTNDALDSKLFTGEDGRGSAFGKGSSKLNDALTSFYVDGRAISDYTGNILADRANNTTNTNSDQIESTIDWAQLSIDNVAPVLSFDYTPYSGSMTVPSEGKTDGQPGKWGQGGKIIVTAEDADIKTPIYDPMQTPSSRPSQGIFMPGKNSGSTSSSGGGLFFYIWSQDPTPPNAGVNFEVIKRYSLASWDTTATAQMTASGSPYASWKKLYDQGLKLNVANNMSEISPPMMALEPENSGAWYLHVWTADMTWDSARQLMQYDLMSKLKYNSSYNASSAQVEKAAEIAAQVTAKLEELSKNGDKTTVYTAADAWKDIATAYMNKVYTKQYRDWLAKEVSGSEPYTDDAEVSARNQAMKQVGEYGDTKTWTLDMFRRDDSNWVQKTAVILFDNKLPAVKFDFSTVVGNNTGRARVKYTVEDADSGIDVERLLFQWVRKPDGAGETRPESTKLLNDIDWIEVEESDIDEYTDNTQLSVTANTLGNVEDDGEYYLSVKVCDIAGNEAVFHSEDTLKVANASKIKCVFSQNEPAEKYYNAVTPLLHLSGIIIDKVSYAVTASAKSPEANAFTELNACGADDKDTDSHYQLPTLGESYADGTWYVHVMVTEKDTESTEPFEFHKTYKLDHTAPELYISPDAGALQKLQYSVSVAASDAASGVDECSLRYQWTTSTDFPALDDESWIVSALDMPIVKTVTNPEENGKYYLHITVTDAIGNTACLTSGAFCFTSGKDSDEPTAKLGSRLVTAYDTGDSFFGVAELELDAEDKTGYRFSVSANGGESWGTWMPYSSMIELLLPISVEEESEEESEEEPEQEPEEKDEEELAEERREVLKSGLESLDKDTLQVRYRTPGGNISEATPISIKSVDLDEILWATATPESMSARKLGKPLALLMNFSDGVSIAANELKNTKPVAKDEEGDFTVVGNGVYYFTVDDGEDKAELCTVVDVFDEVIPEGVVTFSEIAKTTANVYATLETSEPVTVEEIDLYDLAGNPLGSKPGSMKYTFSENGRAVFKFADAAGNENSVTATVRNIDRSTPDVEIMVSYSNGEDKVYSTYVTAADTTLSHGLFLTPIKAESGNQKEFTVVKGGQNGVIEVTANGTYSFTVRDNMGNFKTVSEKIDSIVTTMPEARVEYTFTSAQNAGLVPGESFKNDKVSATIRIPAPEDGRSMYFGKVKGDYSAPLDREGDDFVLRKTYQANGSKTLYFNDGIGGIITVEIEVTGIDTTAPTITLNNDTVVLQLPEDDTVLTGESLITALGGCTVSDKETPEMVVMSLYQIGLDATPISFDKSSKGTYLLRYHVVDGAGNENFADQTVIALSPDDLFVQADGQLLINSNKTAIVPTNHVHFTVDRTRMQQMFFRGSRVQNRSMRYDVLYTGGLYREGQLKYIAQKLTGEELERRTFDVTFDKPGWYSIIIRNQERSSVFTTFFISSIDRLL